MKALLGGPLAGSNLVRLVYMDEAGISNPKHEPHVVMAGIVVHADSQLRSVTNSLERLVRKHVPKSQQDGFVFHGNDIFNGVKSMDKNDPHWTFEKRMRVASGLAQIIVEQRLLIALGMIEKSRLAEYGYDDIALKAREKTNICLGLCYLQCALSVEKWIRRNHANEYCMVICENNNDSRGFISAIQNYGLAMKHEQHSEKGSQQYLPFRHIMHDPSFQNKQPGSVLQLADFCAYVWKRVIPEKTKERFLPYYAPWSDQILETFLGKR